MFFFQFTRRPLVFSLLIRQLVQQFPRGHIRRPGRCSRVESACLQLHHFRLLPGHLHTQRPDQPHRFPLQESLHVFPSNQRNVISKTLPEHGKQAVAVPHFFLAHFFEHFRRRWILVPQRIRKFSVNPAVFLFRGDRNRQNLFFRQILELFQHRSPSSHFCDEEESHKPSREVILSRGFVVSHSQPSALFWASRACSDAVEQEFAFACVARERCGAL